MTGWPEGYLWVPKDVRVGSPGWAASVVRSPTCPDQRKYRRLTRAERRLYEAETV